MSVKNVKYTIKKKCFNNPRRLSLKKNKKNNNNKNNQLFYHGIGETLAKKNCIKFFVFLE